MHYNNRNKFYHDTVILSKSPTYKTPNYEKPYLYMNLTMLLQQMASELIKQYFLWLIKL